MTAVPTKKRSSLRCSKTKASRALLCAFAVFSLGCSVAAEDYNVDEDQGSTHAVVRIRRAATQEGATRGDALTGFVRVPSGTDPESIFALAGLVQPRPSIGDCRLEGAPGEGVDLSGLSQAELLEAQSMDLMTVAGTHSLAPFAFPTVADLLRGVVYTSRDQSGSALPDGVDYSVEARGVEGPDANSPISLSSHQESPKLPAGVTVQGKPLAALASLAPTDVLDLSWQASENPSDTILVTVRSPQVTWNCSFADSEGFGAVPLLTNAGIQLAEAGTEAQLEVHRIRSVSQPGEGGLAEVRVTFDFAVEAIVTFAPSEK